MAPQWARIWEGPLVTETTDLFSGSSDPSSTEQPSSTEDRIAADLADRTSDSAGSSLGQGGAVRSWVGGREADAQEVPGTGRLASMLNPELQRLAQSLGITGTGRMRKGQLIAAIEERQHGSSAVGARVGESSRGQAEPVQVQVEPPQNNQTRHDQRHDQSEVN